MSSERHCLKVRVTEKIREFLRASLDEKEIKTKLEEKILQELEQSLETYSEGEITEESKSNEFCEKELKFSSLKLSIRTLQRSRKTRLNIFLTTR